MDNTHTELCFRFIDVALTETGVPSRAQFVRKVLTDRSVSYEYFTTGTPDVKDSLCHKIAERMLQPLGNAHNGCLLLEEPFLDVLANTWLNVRIEEGTGSLPKKLYQRRVHWDGRMEHASMRLKKASLAGTVAWACYECAICSQKRPRMYQLFQERRPEGPPAASIVIEPGLATLYVGEGLAQDAYERFELLQQVRGSGCGCTFYSGICADLVREDDDMS